MLQNLWPFLLPNAYLHTVRGKWEEKRTGPSYANKSLSSCPYDIFIIYCDIPHPQLDLMTFLLNELLPAFQEPASSSLHVEQPFVSRLQGGEIQKVYERVFRRFLSSLDTILWKLNGTYPRKMTFPSFEYICGLCLRFAGRSPQDQTVRYVRHRLFDWLMEKTHRRRGQAQEGKRQ